jgi:DNA-binding NtrC family response regulator
MGKASRRITVNNCGSDLENRIPVYGKMAGRISTSDVLVTSIQSEHLRRQSRTARVPVIMLTAMDGQMARLCAGAGDFVSKPFSRVGDLLNRIRKVLGSRPEPAGPVGRGALDNA